MKLTKPMKDALQIIGKGGAIIHLTTSSLHGITNTVAERFITVFKDEYILIADMFAQKTRVNLNENPTGVITLAHPVKGRTWSFSGATTILQEGLPSDFEFEGIKASEVLEEWGNWAEKEPPTEVPPDIRPPRMVQRGVIIMKVIEINDYSPQKAGDKIKT
ncbi:MAG: hypothetical protein L3J11_05015 [Draconibacterium sp.]|nr:hypothetical protein [Draconibacterium sp.]